MLVLILCLCSSLCSGQGSDDETKSWKANNTFKSDNVPSVSQSNLWIPDEDAGKCQISYVNSHTTQDTFLSENITHVRPIHFLFPKKLDSLSKNIELEKVTLNQILGPKNEILLKTGTNVRLSSLT